MRIIIFIGIISSVICANAQTRTITNSGNWSNSANWNGGNIGGDVDNDDDVTMNDNVDITIQDPQNYTIATFSPSKNGSLTIDSGATLTVTGVFDIAKETTITVDGTLIIGGDFDVKKALTLNVTGAVIVQQDLKMAKDAVLNINGDNGIEIQGNATFNKDSQINGAGPLCVGGTCTQNGTPDLCNDDQVCSLTSLPVEYASINAELHEDGVEINWTTATEKNNDFFRIQRSYNGETWHDIGTLDGAGNSSDPQFYFYLDTDPFLGVNYYRIVQTDFDGTESISNIVSVNIEDNSAFDISVYPNPTHVGEPLHVHFNGVYEGHVLHLTILDLSGRIVHVDAVEVNEYHGNHVVVDTGNLAVGTYIIVAINGNEKVNHKLIVR